VIPLPAVEVRKDEKIKADILNRLVRRGCWGGRYLPAETLVNWISRRVRKDGHRVRRIIGELHKAGLLLKHKGGRTISLNTRRVKEIMEYIDRNIENG